MGVEKSRHPMTLNMSMRVMVVIWPMAQYDGLHVQSSSFRLVGLKFSPPFGDRLKISWESLISTCCRGEQIKYLLGPRSINVYN